MLGWRDLTYQGISLNSGVGLTAPAGIGYIAWVVGMETESIGNDATNDPRIADQA